MAGAERSSALRRDTLALDKPTSKRDFTSGQLQFLTQVGYPDWEPSGQVHRALCDVCGWGRQLEVDDEGHKSSAARGGKSLAPASFSSNVASGTAASFWARELSS